MGGEPKAEINRLRMRAGRVGLTIRTQRSKGASPRRAYSLVERTTGKVLHRDIDGLIDVEAVLSRIVWDRQLARADGPPAAATTPSCPLCGTPRIGQFRWCRSCGRDFEPTAHIMARWPPFQLSEPEQTTAPVQPTTAPVQPTTEPVQPTTEPVQPTTAPVQPTTGPVQPTTAPVQPTTAPVQPTTGPVQPTTEAVPPTGAPSPSAAVPIRVPGQQFDPDPRRRWRPALRIPFRDRDSFLTIREVGIGAVLGLLIGGATAILLNMR